MKKKRTGEKHFYKKLIRLAKKSKKLNDESLQILVKGEDSLTKQLEEILGTNAALKEYQKLFYGMVNEGEKLANEILSYENELKKLP